jgi:signal transduction histidine kinase
MDRKSMNGREHPGLSRVLLIIAAAFAFAVVAVHGITGYRATRIVVGEFAETTQDADTIVAIDRVLDDVVNAETGQRGFLLTDDRRYLGPYQQGLRQIAADLQNVDRLTAREPDQQARLRILRNAIAESFSELARSINAYDRLGSRSAIAIVGSDHGRQIMATVRRTIREMRNHEEEQRATARAHANASSRSVLDGIVIATSVAALLLLLTFAQFAAAARANQRARQESESANRMKDQFLATVSHELRTPLTSILGWSAMLSENNLERDTAREGLSAIQSAASVQKKLIEDLLDVSRIQSGKLRLSMRTVDLTDAVRVAIDSMRPAAAAKSIDIVTQLESGIRIWGDPDRFQQIVWNLITNAVKFTPRGGRIDVNVSSIGSQASIEIRDTGEGIDPSFLGHVFEPFRQSDSSRALIHKGLGLGLSIVKYLVEAHGGTVSCWSAGKGQGATFRVTMPMQGVAAVIPSRPTVSAMLAQDDVNSRGTV